MIRLKDINRKDTKNFKAKNYYKLYRCPSILLTSMKAGKQQQEN
jgi:hypothetical protein